MKVIRLAAPDIRGDDIRRVTAVLRSGQLVQGPMVARFEHSVARYARIDACAAVSSGTAALHLALLALGIGRRDAVIVPAFTFPATANVVERVGARVVPCDVDPLTYVMTPELLQKAAARARAAAVIVVHEFGYPADMARIRAVARRHGLRVIEDAACALGTRTGGAHPGRFGDVACLSFHPRKAVTTGEGGAVLARNRKVVESVRELRNHGIRARGGRTDFVAAGLNYRMTDIQAALGIGQLARFGAELRRRKRLAARYFRRLRGLAGIALPADHEGHSWQTFMVVLDPRVDRRAVIAQLARRGIQSNLGAQAIHCLGYYRSRYGWRDAAWPVAARLYRQGLALPLHGAVSAQDVDFVCAALADVLNARR